MLHRPGKGGLGAAYLAGFGWALDQGYGAVVEMDADGSHQPEQLPDPAGRAGGRRPGARLPLGARRADASTGRSRGEFISRGGSFYARLMLGIPLRDATGGYRVYRADTLRAIGLDEIDSQGYCFQIDLARRTLGAGLRVVEVPITFVERVHGTSKMSKAIVFEAFWRVGWWGLAGRWAKLRGHDKRPAELTHGRALTLRCARWLARRSSAAWLWPGCRRRAGCGSARAARPALPPGRRWTGARAACPSGCAAAWPCAAWSGPRCS